MTKIISIANQKGGVGKTTTAINISSFIAEFKKKVLLIDLDGQSNTSAGVGYHLTENEYSTYNLMTNNILTARDIIRKTVFKFDLIPSHVNLSGIDLELINRLGRESVLKKKIEPITKDYDFIIIDTPPSLSLLTVNSLVSSTDVFIAVESNPLALDGLSKLYETIEAIKSELNPLIKVTGVIVTMYDCRTKLGQTVINKLRADRGTKNVLFKTFIRRNIKLAEAIDSGKPINFYNKSCNGYEDYKKLSGEIIKSIS